MLNKVSDARSEERFRVHVSCEEPPLIAITDLWRNRQVAAWHGKTADRIRQSGVIPPASRPGVAYHCSKRAVRELFMAAAAVCLPEVDAGLQLVYLNQHRIRRDRKGRSCLHDRILELLFSYPGHHFSEQDILCITALHYPSVTAQRVSRCLRDIVDWRLVQRIEIDAANVFFDTDTTPHLHVYDPDKRELLDAPTAGFVTAAAR